MGYRCKCGRWLETKKAWEEHAESMSAHRHGLVVDTPDLSNLLAGRKGRTARVGGFTFQALKDAMANGKDPYRFSRRAVHADEGA